MVADAVMFAMSSVHPRPRRIVSGLPVRVPSSPSMDGTKGGLDEMSDEHVLLVTVLATVKSKGLLGIENDSLQKPLILRIQRGL
jgi:hypothetical protein